MSVTAKPVIAAPLGQSCHADPAAELPAVCAAYDATIHLASIRGLRTLPFREFNIGFMATALEADEMVAAIDLPIWRQGHGYGFQEFARRHGDFALAGAQRFSMSALTTLCGRPRLPCAASRLRRSGWKRRKRG